MKFMILVVVTCSIYIQLYLFLNGELIVPASFPE